MKKIPLFLFIILVLSSFTYAEWVRPLSVTSSNLDNVCNQDGSFLYRFGGIWGCGLFNTSNISMTITYNSTNITYYVPNGNFSSDIYLNNHSINNANFVYLNRLLFNTTYTDGHTEGSLHWDDDIKTVEVDTNIENFEIPLGHTLVRAVVNKLGFTIYRGQAVYINGAQGNRATVNLSIASDEVSTSKLLGLMAHDCDDSMNCYVIFNGDLNYVDTTTWNIGDNLYVSNVLGNLTNIKPVAPLHTTSVGKVVVKNINGTIGVRVQNGFEITELHDVNGTAPSISGKVLVWDNVSGIYNPQDVPYQRNASGWIYNNTTIVTNGSPNVGIGTTNPGGVFDIMSNGQVFIRPQYSTIGVTGGYGVNIGGKTDNDYYILTVNGSTGQFVKIFNAQNGALTVWGDKHITFGGNINHVYNSATIPPLHLGNGAGNGAQLSLSNGNDPEVGWKFISHWNTNEMLVTRGSDVNWIWKGKTGQTANLMSWQNSTGGSLVDISINGKVGFGTTNPVNKVDIEGALAVGATYSGTNTAPVNGLLVEGNVGIGTTSPDAPLQLENANRATFVMAKTGLNNPFTDTTNLGAWHDGSVVAVFNQASSSNGGISIQGFTGNSSTTNAFLFDGHMGSASPSVSAILIRGWKTNGTTSRTALNGTERILGIASGSGAELFSFLANGYFGLGTTNPQFKLDVNGSLNVNGNATINLPFINIWNFTDGGYTLSIADTNVYYNFSNWILDGNNAFSFNSTTGIIKPQINGSYEIIFGTSINCGLNGIYGIGIKKNSVNPEGTQCYTHFEGAGTHNTRSFNCVMSMNTNDNLSVVIDDEGTPAQNCNVIQQSLTIKRLMN